MTPEGFGQAYSKGFEMTIRFLTSRGLNREHAREISQAAWVRGLESIAQLRDDRFLLTWVNTIALNFQRKAARAVPLTTSLDGFENRHPTTINLAAIDVKRILSRCSPAGRQLLRDQMNGVTSSELAGRHGLTPTAVRLRMMRARREARARMMMSSVAVAS